MTFKLEFLTNDVQQRLLWRLNIRIAELDDLFSENSPWVIKVTATQSIVRFSNETPTILYHLKEAGKSCYLSSDKTVILISPFDTEDPVDIYPVLFFHKDPAVNYIPFPFVFNPQLTFLYETYLNNFKDFSLVAAKVKFGDRKDFERSIFGKSGTGRAYYARVTIENQKEVVRRISEEASHNVRFILRVKRADDIVDSIYKPLNRYITFINNTRSLWETERIRENMYELLSNTLIQYRSDLSFIKHSAILRRYIRINDIRGLSGTSPMDQLLLWVMRDPTASSDTLLKTIAQNSSDKQIIQNVASLYGRFGKTYSTGLIHKIGETPVLNVMHKFPKDDAKLLLKDVQSNELLVLRVLAAHPQLYTNQQFSVSLPPSLDYRLKCHFELSSSNISEERKKLQKYWETTTYSSSVPSDELLARFDIVNSTGLSYQGLNSKSSYELRSAFFRRNCSELAVSEVTHSKNPDKRRVAFLSPFLARHHSISNDRKGLIQQLSYIPHFEIYVCVTQEPTEDTKGFYSNCKVILLDPSNFSSNVKRMLSLHLDVLVFCELGLDNMTYFLAHKRFAPVQLTTWGHSDTSGIKDTVDGYVTSSFFHVDQDAFTEKIYAMNSLSTYYFSVKDNVPITTNKEAFLKALGIIPKDGILWVCLQNSIKYSQEFLNTLSQMAKYINENDMIIVLTDTPLPIKIKGITCVYRMPYHTYLALLSIADAALDTFPFCGCNTTLEALSLGVPVICMDTKTLSGSFSKGFYQAMGFTELIANSSKEYMYLFKILHNNQDFRDYCKRQIKKHARVLFEQQNVVDDWENLITKLSSFSLSRTH